MNINDLLPLFDIEDNDFIGIETGYGERIFFHKKEIRFNPEVVKIKPYSNTVFRTPITFVIRSDLNVADSNKNT